MKKEIEALVREHRNIERLLDAMIAVLIGAGDETWARRFLEGALVHLGGFEREIHHRKEQALFKRLVALDGSLQEVRDRLGEHGKLLADMEKDLHRSVRELEGGDAGSRGRLKAQAAAYREAYRNCIAVEEGLLYGAADTRLLPRDWRQLFGRYAHRKFPAGTVLTTVGEGSRRRHPPRSAPPSGS